VAAVIRFRLTDEDHLSVDNARYRVRAWRAELNVSSSKKNAGPSCLRKKAPGLLARRSPRPRPSSRESRNETDGIASTESDHDFELE